MKEKIKKLKELGVTFVVKEDYNDYSPKYDEIIIRPYFTDEDVERLIDDKLKFYEDKEWPSIMKTCSAHFTICDACRNRSIYMSQKYDFPVETKVTCLAGHYESLREDLLRPVLNCKDYDKINLK